MKRIKCNDDELNELDDDDDDKKRPWKLNVYLFNSF